MPQSLAMTLHANFSCYMIDHAEVPYQERESREAPLPESVFPWPWLHNMITSWTTWPS